MISCNTCEFQGGFTASSSNSDQTSGFCQEVPISNSHLSAALFLPSWDQMGDISSSHPSVSLCQNFANRSPHLLKTFAQQPWLKVWGSTPSEVKNGKRHTPYRSFVISCSYSSAPLSPLASPPPSLPPTSFTLMEHLNILKEVLKGAGLWGATPSMTVTWFLWGSLFLPANDGDGHSRSKARSVHPGVPLWRGTSNPSSLFSESSI